MENPTPSDFEKNVFINCPFDSAYLALLRPLLFTIVSFGFIPKIASERSDSAEQRIDKIYQGGNNRCQQIAPLQLTMARKKPRQHK